MNKTPVYEFQSLLLPEQLVEHANHHVVIANYANGQDYALECEDCNEVLADAELKQ